jgi:acyl-coenzyme A synthetase/AMP-(fatty) acid ligase
VIPIGVPLPQQECIVVGEDLEPVPQGQVGELLLGGNQLSEGYVSARTADHAKFFSHEYIGKQSTQWYRSGDLASESYQWGLIFHGRVDTQIKLRGYRIELQEVEHFIREACQAAICAVIPWPLDANDTPVGLVAFVPQGKIGVDKILAACRSSLPEYAVPDRIVQLDAFPLNSNGKIDRNKLRQICELEPEHSSF